MGADPTWPNIARCSIPCDVTLGSAGGGGAAGTLSLLGSVRRRCGPRERVCFFSCFFLICIIVVPVPSVCCSVKLPLCRPTSFRLLLAILLRTPAGGGAAVWRFCCWRQPNQHSMLVNLFGKRLNAHCPPAKWFQAFGYSVQRQWSYSVLTSSRSHFLFAVSRNEAKISKWKCLNHSKLGKQGESAQLWLLPQLSLFSQLHSTADWSS